MLLDNLDIRHSEDLPNGAKLIVVGDHFKPRIYWPDGVVTYLSLNLKHVYDRGKGFVKRIERPDADCIKLAQDWAYRKVGDRNPMI